MDNKSWFVFCAVHGGKPSSRNLEDDLMPRWGNAQYNPRVVALLESMRSEQSAITTHEVYGLLGDIDAVRVFMEHHVYAVWDFMSLLTALRSQLTCGSVPWRPVGSAGSRRFANELILAEESDEIGGDYRSHFEYYLDAMEAVDADTHPIRQFVEMFDGSEDLHLLLRRAGVPASAREFVARTWKAIESGYLPTIVGAFAFGRESLIPSMFSSLRPLAACRPELELFCDYLDRHIELDGDVHAPLAYNIVSEACGDDNEKWESVRQAALEALRARRSLWDGIVTAVRTPDDRGRFSAAAVPVSR